ncbi:MAG: ABC transporter permease [Leptolyngbya sp. SIOISBB]|nr:ABC transporter permease [Leptolyngbya sp. SIOISBB]
MALSPADLILTTFRDLGGNWVRSGLTTLGIFMGVAAVNATLNIEAITAAQIQQKLALRDNPFVIPWIYDPTGTKPPPELGEEDFVAMQQVVPGIYGVGQSTRVFNVDQVRHQGQVSNEADIEGVSLNFQQMTGRQMLAGRFFQQSDFDEYYPVAVIDSVLAEQLFTEAPPVGQGLFLDTIRLTVIGVVETKRWRGDSEPSGTVWVTQNYADAIAGQFTWGRTQVAIAQLENYQAVEDGVTTFLEQRYPGFEVGAWGNAEDLYREEQQQRTSTRILKGVGVLALVIGGVGIANITIAAVMERTREIGLRRAIGATDWEVMVQFIAEAALLSLIGGTAAIATIHGLTKVATTQVFEAPYTFRVQDAAISMGAAFVVGVGASFFPALRITQIDVVQALRGE